MRFSQIENYLKKLKVQRKKNDELLVQKVDKGGVAVAVDKDIYNSNIKNIINNRVNFKK